MFIFDKIKNLFMKKPSSLSLRQAEDLIKKEYREKISNYINTLFEKFDIDEWEVCNIGYEKFVIKHKKADVSFDTSAFNAVTFLSPIQFYPNDAEQKFISAKLQESILAELER